MCETHGKIHMMDMVIIDTTVLEILEEGGETGPPRFCMLRVSNSLNRIYG